MADWEVESVESGLGQVRRPVREQTWNNLYRTATRQRKVFASKYASLKRVIRGKPGEAEFERMMNRSIDLFDQWDTALLHSVEPPAPPPGKREFDFLRDLLVEAVAQNIATLRTVQDRAFFRKLEGFGALGQEDDFLPPPTAKEVEQAEGRVQAGLLEGKTVKAAAVGLALVGLGAWLAFRRGGGLGSTVCDPRIRRCREPFSELNGLGAALPHCVELEFMAGGRPTIAQCYQRPEEAEAAVRRVNNLADKEGYGITANVVPRPRRKDARKLFGMKGLGELSREDRRWIFDNLVGSDKKITKEIRKEVRRRFPPPSKAEVRKWNRDRGTDIMDAMDDYTARTGLTMATYILQVGWEDSKGKLKLDGLSARRM